MVYNKMRKNRFSASARPERKQIGAKFKDPTIDSDLEVIIRE